MSGIDYAALSGWQSVLVVLLIVVVFGGLLGGTIYAALKAADHPPPIALVVVLTSVTLALISAYLLSRDQELLTLAGMGLGALSGAVAAVWSGRNDR